MSQIGVMRILLICLSIVSFLNIKSQEIVDLPIKSSNSEITWDNQEQSYFSNTWQTQVVTNVSQPRLLVYLADPEIATGSAVIICPGGGMYAHSINSEGINVAEWLNKKGISAFVLKYRLVPTHEDATVQINTDGPNVEKKARKLLPYATDDALNAISHVRSHAEDYHIDKSKLGLMGFSAGGAVIMNATNNYNEDSRPSFIAPIYAWMNIVDVTQVPGDAPPIFVACANDDPLKLAAASVKLYQDWADAGKSAELHMFAKGGHGFGMRPLGFPSDKWIEHFFNWLTGEGF